MAGVAARSAIVAVAKVADVLPGQVVAAGRDQVRTQLVQRRQRVVDLRRRAVRPAAGPGVDQRRAVEQLHAGVIASRRHPSTPTRAGVA